MKVIFALESKEYEKGFEVEYEWNYPVLPAAGDLIDLEGILGGMLTDDYEVLYAMDLSFYVDHIYWQSEKGEIVPRILCIGE